MYRRLAACLFATLPFLSAGTAFAGPYADALARCVVSHTGEADQVALVRWIIVAYSAHPDVRDIVSVNESLLEPTYRRAAEIFERLLTDDCVAETRDAYRYEGQTALNVAFSFFGQAAARGLVGDSSVQERINAFTEFLDLEKINRTLGVE